MIWTQVSWSENEGFHYSVTYTYIYYIPCWQWSSIYIVAIETNKNGSRLRNARDKILSQRIFFLTTKHMLVFTYWWETDATEVKLVIRNNLPYRKRFPQVFWNYQRRRTIVNKPRMLGRECHSFRLFSVARNYLHSIQCKRSLAKHVPWLIAASWIHKRHL